MNNLERLLFAHREWEIQREDHRIERQRFREGARGAWIHDGRQGNFRYVYPDNLYYNFPEFPTWLNQHVRNLKDEGFPLEPMLDALHCPPSTHALSYDSMWAYGSKYRCCPDEEGPTHVAFDCGIATSTPDSVTTAVDVGILKSILLISYGTLKCVVMKGKWIPPMYEGRRSVKKDKYGFWTVRYRARYGPNQNPYVFPLSVSQVFFMPDAVDAEWKVVLRADARSRRIVGDREVIDFGAPGTSGSIAMSRNSTAASSLTENPALEEPEVQSVPLPEVQVLDAMAEREEDDSHFDDDQHVDEFQVQWME